MNARRRQRYDVIRPTQAVGDKFTVYAGGAYINGEYVPIKGTRLVPNEAPALPIRKETNSKPRRHD